MATIAIPISLDAAAAIDFAASLSSHVATPMVTIDFASLRSVEPFGLLYAGAALRTFFKQREFRGIAAKGVSAGEPAHEYLAHVGFFQWIGIQVGKSPGAVLGGPTWLPLTTLTRAQLDARISETGKPLGSVIHQECDRFARVVTQSSQMKVTAPLAYCLREVIRNVFEHAEIDRCVLCAQKSSDKSVELAVIDQGHGIRHSLEQRFGFDNDEEALRAALRPGISRRALVDTDDPWANSGFGLFVLSELGRELGIFRVISGSAGMVSFNGEFHSEAAQFDGTAIQLRIRRPKGVNLGDFIDSMISRGEAANGTSLPRRASRSTRTIHPS